VNGTAIPSAARHGRAARYRLQRGSLRNLQAPTATMEPGPGPGAAEGARAVVTTLVLPIMASGAKRWARR
jgi:hypothetical protein